MENGKRVAERTPPKRTCKGLHKVTSATAGHHPLPEVPYTKRRRLMHDTNHIAGVERAEQSLTPAHGRTRESDAASAPCEIGHLTRSFDAGLPLHDACNIIIQRSHPSHPHESSDIVLLRASARRWVHVSSQVLCCLQMARLPHPRARLHER